MFPLDFFKNFLKNISIKILDKIYDYYKYKLLYECSNIEIGRKILSLYETILFVEQYMYNVPSFTNKFSLLEYSLSLIESTSDGFICEFGVASGLTINFIAEKVPNKIIYGFDSFEGLPEDWRDGFPKGTFKMSKLPEVNKNVELFVGLFSDTLPFFIKNVSGNALFLHIDCDLYSSTKTIFENLFQFIKSGTIIVFDEYFNYPGWKAGEYKAFLEFIQISGKSFEYIGYNKFGEQVAVKIL